MTNIKYLTLSILLIIGGLLYSTSNSEIEVGAPSVIFADGSEINLFSLKLENEYGFTKFIYEFVDNSFDENSAIIKIDNNYFSPNWTRLNSEAASELVNSISYISNDIKLTKVNHDVDYSYGNFDVGTLNASILYNSINTDNNFKVKQRPDNFDIEIYIFSNSGKAVRLKTQLYLSFFKSEYDILNKLLGDTDLTYEEKAMFFLSTLFIEETEETEEEGEITEVNYSGDRVDFLNFIKSKYSDSIFPDLKEILGNEFGQGSLYSDLKKSHIDFKSSFYKNFHIKKANLGNSIDSNSDNKINLPYLNFDKDTFFSVYEDNNIYIKVYLNYLLNEGKPLLSKLLNNQISQKNIKYNYGQYEPVSEDDGKKIAKSALRYLTWGVEYTLDGITNNLATTDSKVFGSNRTTLNLWMANDLIGRDKNYLHKIPKTLDKPGIYSNYFKLGSTHILNGSYSGNKFRFINQFYKSNGGYDSKVSRVDFFTSENIAWINDKINGVYISSNELITDFSTSSAKKFFDKKIDTNTLSNKLFQRNIIPDDPDTPDVDEYECPDFTYGYSFKDSETIGALLVVTGHDFRSNIFNTANSYDNLKESLYNYRNSENHNFSIVYNNNIPVENVKEIIVSDVNACIDIAKNESLGFSFAGSEHLVSNKSQLKYHYFIFNEPIENVNDIKIVDKTGTSSLSITEFMVFPDNPILQYTSLINDNIKKTNSHKIDNIKHDLEWDYYNFDDLGYSTSSSIRSLYNPVLTNNNPSIAKDLGVIDLEDSQYSYFDIDTSSTKFNSTFDYKQIVIHSFNTNNNSGNNYVNSFKDDFVVLKDAELEITEGLILSNSINKSLITNLYDERLLTTPFKTQGNPLPYVTAGIDSPKTFNYKMLEQNNVREDYFNKYKLLDNNGDMISDNYQKRYRFPYSRNDEINTTLAVDHGRQINYFSSYFSEYDLYNEIGTSLNRNYSTNEYLNLPSNVPDNLNSLQPFLPGLYLDGYFAIAAKDNSLYSLEKTAGVDSIGILAGSLAMSNIGDYNILNVFNDSIDENLNTIFKNNEFKYHYRNGDDEYIPLTSKPIRLNSADIEKSSVLVPNIKDIQLGDILVKYYESGIPHIGIVVDIPESTDALTVDQIMEQTVVISTSREYRIANLGLWKSSGNTFGGFTSVGSEKDYHLRRLLKIEDDIELIDYEDKEWELLNKTLVSLEVDINLKKDKYDPNVKARWIPNTDELLNIGNIYISGSYTGDSNDKIDDYYSDVKILAPLDPYSDEEPDLYPADSNIYKNKGQGIEFYAVSGDDSVLLATFNRNIDGSYQVNYSNVFNTDGSAKEGYKLKIDVRSLTFYHGSNPYREFAVKTIDGTAIPGDDFYLNFGLVLNDKIKGSAKEDDIIAVYDKKALWRANLYIDEGEHYDWNNKNPWVEGNEWNSGDMDGEQNISFPEFTPISQAFGDTVKDTVAYSYPDDGFSPYFHDSPAEYLTKMNHLKETLAKYYNEDGIKFNKPKNEWINSSGSTLTQISDFGFADYKNFIDDSITEEQFNLETFEPISLESWDSTEAPKNGNDIFWSNYVFTNDVSKLSYAPGMGLLETGYGSNNNRVAAGLQQTYTETPQMNSKTAGLDCIGFAQRSFSYNNNFYSWPNLNAVLMEYDSGVKASRTYPRIKVDAEEDASWDQHSDLIASNAEYTPDYELKRIVPGDIMYHGNGSHIAIVRSVEYNTDGYIDLTTVKLIESTYYTEQLDGVRAAFVTNRIDFNQKYSERNWKIVRLKRN